MIPLKGLIFRISSIIPIKVRGVINQGSTVCLGFMVRIRENGTVRYKVCRDNGKENGNYYLGFRVWAAGLRALNPEP